MASLDMSEATAMAVGSGDEKQRKPRSDQVPIRLPSGEQVWVGADAFNLISEREFHDSERLRRVKGQRNLAATVAALALIAFASGAITLLTRRDRGETPATAEALSTKSQTSGSSEGFAELPAPAPAVPATTPEAREVEETVLSWAQAWSAQDYEAVLSYYSPSFLVPDGMGRETWEQLRGDRVVSPDLLEVTIDHLAVELREPGIAIARFVQIYDTPGYRAWVMKTLELAVESGRWLIIDELASLTEVGTGAYKAGEAELIHPPVSPTWHHR